MRLQYIDLSIFLVFASKIVLTALSMASLVKFLPVLSILCSLSQNFSRNRKTALSHCYLAHHLITVAHTLWQLTEYRHSDLMNKRAALRNGVISI